MSPVATPESADASTVYLLITSPTPLPPDELQRRARLALQEAGLEAAPPADTSARDANHPKPRLTKEERFAMLREAIIQVEERTSTGTPMTEAEIVAAVRVVYQERADQARAAKG